MAVEYENPWERILSLSKVAIPSMVYTYTKHTPSQQVFGRNIILNINQETNWQLITQHKLMLFNKGNTIDNLICIEPETKSY